MDEKEPDLKIFEAEKQLKQTSDMERKHGTAYTNYLNSFIKVEDRRYLPNDSVVLRQVPLRAAVGTMVMTPSQFNEVHLPTLGKFIYFSDKSVANDPLTMALAEREKLNVSKTLSTIIFVSTRDSKGFCVSGYIDLEQSLRCFQGAGVKGHPWADIFAGRRRLEPNQQDLSFITWNNGKVFYNDSDNYKIIPDAVKGLCFLYKGDGSLLTIEKYITDEHPRCKFIESPKHGSTVIYDHRIRRKM
ncbi:cilia- and flagella-associated protein 299 isoform X1 [Drosophila elegans]|uniref:cilia- and flagella-associated protein 299 isoform X1 n=1 Tax=Drosophila elegans TaxID=30023 RepID=UPI0007E763E6|nr:cilia- and flagella-associated protein 299 isoform X1 [Drosophila elegans]